jgi:hypothetical protein
LRFRVAIAHPGRNGLRAGERRFQPQHIAHRLAHRRLHLQPAHAAGTHACDRRALRQRPQGGGEIIDGACTGTRGRLCQAPLAARIADVELQDHPVRLTLVSPPLSSCSPSEVMSRNAPVASMPFAIPCTLGAAAARHRDFEPAQRIDPLPLRGEMAETVAREVAKDIEAGLQQRRRQRVAPDAGAAHRLEIGPGLPDVPWRRRAACSR